MPSNPYASAEYWADRAIQHGPSLPSRSFPVVKTMTELNALPVGSVVMGSVWAGGVHKKVGPRKWKSWDESWNWERSTESLLSYFGRNTEFVVLKCEKAETDG